MIIPESYLFLLITLSIAAACSLVHFRQHAVHIKIISGFLFVDLIGELMASFGFNFLKKHFNLNNNLGIYNAVILFEFILLSIYFYKNIEYGWFRKICSLLLFIFPAFWIITGHFGFGEKFNTYASVFLNLFVTFCCIIFFYVLYNRDNQEWLFRNTEFWITAALFIYYTCNLPCTAIINYIGHIHTKDDSIGFITAKLMLALRLLNILMYLTITYAFACQWMNKKK